jgi:hypothetical protein
MKHSIEESLLYTHAYDNPPLSWKSNGIVIEKLYEKMGFWKKEQIDWLFGIEIDFVIIGREEINLEQLRDEIIIKLAEEVKILSNKEELKLRIKAIKEFSNTDLIMYKIHEELADVIEYRFGPGLFQTGYYDNPGFSEVRINPKNAIDAIINYHQTVKTINHICKKYNHFAAILGYHLNFSIHKNGKNLTEVKDEESLKFVEQIIEGILKVTAENHLLLAPLNSRPYSAKVSAGLERGHMYRMCQNRIECRLSKKGEETHMALLILNILAGAELGYFYSTSKEYVQACINPSTRINGVSIEKTEESFYARRVIQSSTINENGKINPSIEYLKIRRFRIQEEIFGLQEGLNSEGLERLAFMFASPQGEWNEAIFKASLTVSKTFFGKVIDPEQQEITLENLGIMPLSKMHAVFCKIRINNNGLDLSELPDNIAAKFKNVKVKEIFKTVNNTGYTISPENLIYHISITKISQSKILNMLFGHEFVNSIISNYKTHFPDLNDQLDMWLSERVNLISEEIASSKRPLKAATEYAMQLADSFNIIASDPIILQKISRNELYIQFAKTLNQIIPSFENASFPRSYIKNIITELKDNIGNKQLTNIQDREHLKRPIEPNNISMNRGGTDRSYT